MERCYSKDEYIRQIAEPARRCCKRYGYRPCVLIAQSCLENGYGMPQDTQVLIAVNNMVGIKRELLNKSWVDIGLSVWQGGYIRKDTPEQYGGQIVTIKDDFRTYDCIERSFADYLCFMTYASNYGAGGEPKYGQKVLTISDPETLIKTVSKLGYATGATYPNSVMRIIRENDLTKYDDLTGVEPTSFVPGIQINPNPHFDPYHNTSARTGAIEFIAVHYVGATGDAKANVDYYNQKSTTDASADFYVGFAGDIWQYNNTPETRYCWAVGGGRQTQYGGAFYQIAKNANVISVEMCVRNKTGGSQPANSPTWYFEDATINSAVRLVQYLMDKYHIPLDHVIRHFDVNGKLCPGVVGWNSASGSEDAWKAFKARLGGSAPIPEPTPANVMYRVQVGAYKLKTNAVKRAEYVRDVTRYANIKAYRDRKPKVQEGFPCFVEKDSDGIYKTYCGSYSIEDNAKKRCERLKGDYDIDCFIKEVNNV